MNNSITYKGDVNIKILHKNRVVKKIFESNTGEMSLFNFLVRCLSGEFNSDLLPYYIMLFNSSESVDFFPDNMNTLEQITFNPIYLASQPTINDNSVTFSTDYETDKFVVLNYPLQDGWNLSRYSEDDEGNIIKEEVQQCKAQGGFIGFVGEKGKQYYLLEYTSPYFNIAAIITIIGLFATLLSLISFTKIDHSQKLKEEYLNSLRHETNLNIKKIKQAYDDCEDNE